MFTKRDKKLTQTNQDKTLTQTNIDGKVTKLTQKQLTAGPLFIIGNDPKIVINKKLAQSNDKFVLIATSGLRALSIACDIASKTNSDGEVDPNLCTIILIDNSSIVCNFWKKLKDAISSKENENTKTVSKNIMEFLKANYKDIHIMRNIDLTRYAPGVEYPDQELVGKFIQELTFNYGLQEVRHVILNTIVIEQSWTHTETFAKIKKLLEQDKINNVYMYPSNIVACIESEIDRKKVLDNIQMMNPVLTIHTDRTPVRGFFSAHGQPMKVHMITDQDSNKVSQLIPFVEAQPYISKKQMLLMLFLVIAAAIASQYLKNEPDQISARPKI